MTTRSYCIKFFLVFALTIGAVFILVEGIETQFAQWWMWAWLAVVADLILEQPVGSIFRSIRGK